MRNLLLLLVCTAVLSVPAVSLAGDSASSLSSKLGARSETPHAKSDPSHSLSICKSHHQGPNFTGSRDGKNGGKGPGAANAFGKCTSTISMHNAESDGNDHAESSDEHRTESHEGDSPESQAKDNANPAMTCKALHANDRARFETEYGTRPNAFGMCVAKHANRMTS